MKCFVIKLKTIITIAFILALAVTLFYVPGIHVVSTLAQRRALPIYSVARTDKTVALTFDTSWGDKTPELLRILNDYNVKTTFFVTGDWADRHGASVTAIHKAGHEVMNHSNTHPHMTRLSAEEMIEEVRKCNEKIKKLTGECPILFRPPFGDYDDKVIRTLESIQMFTINWDVDSLDWKNTTGMEIQKRVLEKTRPGSIILFHCTGKHTLDALPDVIQSLQAEGYRIVPVTQLIYHENYTIDYTGRQKKG